MPVFFFKSVLSLFAFIAMFTMFEVLGRSEKRYNIERLKKIHRVNGNLIALLTFGVVATSAGNFFLFSGFAMDMTAGEIMRGHKKEVPKEIANITVKADSESISRGKELYESKCYFCHDAYSNKTTVGPGHKGILKNLLLPESRRPATPENVANQMRHPYKEMPSFAYLSDSQIQDIIAFLNTL